MEERNNSYGDLIKKARLAAGLTQNELANILGIPFQSVSQWERGTRIPKVETLDKIASALKCDPFYLLGLSESMEYSKQEKEYFSVTDFIKGLGYEELPVKYENEDGEFDEIGKRIGTTEDGATVFGSTDPQNEIENRNDGKKYLVPRLEWEELKRRIVRYSNFEISEYLSTKEPEKE